MAPSTHHRGFRLVQAVALTVALLSRGLLPNRVDQEMPYHRLVTPGAMVFQTGGKASTAGTELSYLVDLSGRDFAEVIGVFDRAAP